MAQGAAAGVPCQPRRHDEQQHAVDRLAGYGREERDGQQYPDDRRAKPGQGRQHPAARPAGIDDRLGASGGRAAVGARAVGVPVLRARGSATHPDKLAPSRRRRKVPGTRACLRRTVAADVSLRKIVGRVRGTSVPGEGGGSCDQHSRDHRRKVAELRHGDGGGAPAGGRGRR